MNKLREIIKIALIQFAIFCGLLFVLIVAIELRYWYKYSMKFSPRGQGCFITWGHKVRYNKWGFRERDFDVSTLHQNGQFVVMVLGDSFTFGTGLDEKWRYSNLLEKYLKSEYHNKKIVVLNFGVGAISTTQERNILRQFYKTTNPDLVILGFVLNDLSTKYDGQRKLSLSWWENPVLRLLYSFHFRGTINIAAFIYEKFLVFSKKVDGEQAEMEMNAYNKSGEEWRNFESALADISGMTKEVTPNNPIFISLNEGVSKKAPTDYNHPNSYLKFKLEKYHQAESAARQAGFIATNVEEELKKFKNYVMAVVLGEDMHPTAQMNEVYAQKLFSVIKEHKFLEN